MKKEMMPEGGTVKEQLIAAGGRIVLLMVCGIVGMLLIVLSYLLPTEPMRRHISSGAYILLQETAQYQYADGYVSATLDNSTEDLILSKVVYSSDDPLQDAALVPNYSFPGQDAGGLILFGTLNGNSMDEAQIDTYPIYWHGYLVILRPFFELFTYADFRILNQILELCLLTAVVCVMQKRRLTRYIPAFAAMAAFWNMGTMGVSLQYAPCYYLSMGAALFLLMKNGKLRNTCTFFMLVGALTSYFDFLTYPVVTFGVPLVFLILLVSKQSSDGRPHRGLICRMCRDVLCPGIWWAIGYAGMWAEKWIYGSVLCRGNILIAAVGKIMERSGTQTGEEQLSRMGTVVYLIRYALGKRAYVVLFMLFAAVILVMSLRQRLHPGATVSDGRQTEASFEQRAFYAELLVIAMLPLVWYYCTANHSYIHPRLVYRSLGVSVFAVLAIATGALERLAAKTKVQERE